MKIIQKTAVALAALLLFGVCGCGISQEPKTLTVFAMDTVVTLTAYGENAGPALDAAVQKLNEYDAALDVVSGDIGNINSHAGEFVEVSAEVYQLLSDCVRISRQTDGAFDVTVGKYIELWGFRSQTRIPSQEELAGAAAFAGRARAVTPCRPNFLFILADDLAPFSLAAYGNAVCRTPHLDRLAAEGMTVDGAHIMGSWSGAVCMPSRTMLMTGRGLWHIPGQGNPHAKDPALVPPDLAAQSLPAVFNRAGYDTFRTCKEGNSYPAANALFKTRHERTCRDDAGDCGSAWHADRVLEHLDRRRTEGARDPFLIYLGFSFPHDPRNAHPDRLARYGAVNELVPDAPVNPAAPPLPANYLPEHPFPHGHPKLRDEEQVQGVMKSRAEAVIRNETGREYACIEEMDAQIGRVLDRLQETGELESTFVVFTADNGIAVGRHGLMGKQNLYEHSWRVPFLARGPGIAPGSRAAGNLYLMDLLPTFCDLASVAAPATCEG